MEHRLVNTLQVTIAVMATMQFSPFYMGNDTIPYETSGYVRAITGRTAKFFSTTRWWYD